MTYSLIGLALVVVGCVSYFFLLDVAWIRSTAIPNLVVAAIGMGLCIFGVVKRPTLGPIALMAVGDLLTIGFVLSLFVLMRLSPPSADAPDVGDAAPAFSLVNHQDKPVALSDYAGKGPVLLVFYRGHW